VNDALSRVTLERAGIEVSPLGFGCASLMRVTTRRARLALLGTALEHGISHFDTARLYGLGAAEGELGKFAKGRRDQITIATKFGIDPARRTGALARFQGPARALMNRVPALRMAVKRRDGAFKAPARRYDAAIAARSLDTSLLQLGVDYVDIYFVHGPGPDDVVEGPELVAFFEQARAAGKIRAWGVSQDNHPEVELLGALGEAALLQVRSDAFDRSTREPDITFGVLGAAHARITSALGADAVLRRTWVDHLGDDVLAPGVLARYLLADAVLGGQTRVALYSTTKPERIADAVHAVATPPPAEALAAFRRLTEQLGSRSGA